MSNSTISRLPPSWDQPFPVRRFTVDEYHRMGECGMLTDNDHGELLEGLIVPQMMREPRPGVSPPDRTGSGSR